MNLGGIFANNLAKIEAKNHKPVEVPDDPKSVEHSEHDDECSSEACDSNIAVPEII